MFWNRVLPRSPDGVDGAAPVADLEGEDIRNQLGADWDKMGGATLDDAAAPVEKPALDPAADPAASDVGRERNPDGTFKAKPEGDGATPAVPLEPVKAAAAATDPAAAAAATGKAEPPARWNAEEKAIFAKLPPDAQKAMAALDERFRGDWTRKTQEAAAVRAEADPILKIFEPHREALALANQTPAGIVQRWAAAEQFLQRDPVEAVTWLVTNYLRQPGGVEALVARLTGEAAPGGEAIDPTVKPLYDRIDRLESHIAGRQRADGEATISRTVQTIDQFLEEKDQSGKPLRPYADDVLDDMIALSKADRASGKQPSLPDLYERAVWANKAVRERMLADQAAVRQGTTRAEEAARVAAARRAGSSLTGSPSPNGARDPQGSIRDALSDAWDATMGTA